MGKKLDSMDTLLIRIDERVTHLHNEDIPELKKDVSEIKHNVNQMNGRVALSEYKINELRKNSVSFNFIRGFRILIKLIIGK